MNEGHDPAPPDVTVSKVPIRVVFAPDHNPEMEIMKQMQKAKKRTDFAIFTFSQSSGIDDTMIAMVASGRKIRGALDGQAPNQVWAATRPVRNAGAELYLVRKKGKLPGDIIGHEYELEYGTDTIEIQSDAVEKGQRVVILDDLLATGGTMAASIELIKKAGIEVVGAACIIELTFLDGRSKLNGIPFDALMAYDE